MGLFGEPVETELPARERRLPVHSLGGYLSQAGITLRTLGVARGHRPVHGFRLGDPLEGYQHAAGFSKPARLGLFGEPLDTELPARERRLPVHSLGGHPSQAGITVCLLRAPLNHRAVCGLDGARLMRLTHLSGQRIALPTVRTFWRCMRGYRRLSAANGSFFGGSLFKLVQVLFPIA